MESIVKVNNELFIGKNRIRCYSRYSWKWRGLSMRPILRDSYIFRTRPLSLGPFYGLFHFRFTRTNPPQNKPIMLIRVRILGVLLSLLGGWRY